MNNNALESQKQHPNCVGNNIQAYSLESDIHEVTSANIPQIKVLNSVVNELSKCPVETLDKIFSLVKIIKSFVSNEADFKSFEQFLISHNDKNRIDTEKINATKKNERNDDNSCQKCKNDCNNKTDEATAGKSKKTTKTIGISSSLSIHNKNVNPKTKESSDKNINHNHLKKKNNEKSNKNG